MPDLEHIDSPRSRRPSVGEPAQTCLEQCQEKWKPVFHPTLRQGKQLDQSSIPRNRTLIQCGGFEEVRYILYFSARSQTNFKPKTTLDS
jgi:hypothetical protein